MSTEYSRLRQDLLQSVAENMNQGRWEQMVLSAIRAAAADGLYAVRVRPQDLWPALQEPSMHTCPVPSAQQIVAWLRHRGLRARVARPVGSNGGAWPSSVLPVDVSW